MCHAAVVSGNIKISNEILNKVNVQFTDEILKKFPDSKCIYISSVSVYGRQEKKINERILESPETDYGVSKLRAEQLILKNKSNKVIRFSSLYGKGMKQNTLIPNYCNQALQNNQIEVWGDGSRFQNYIHIEDAVALIEKVIELNEVIDFPILGVDTTEYSNLQVAEIISEKINSKITFVNEDYSISYFYDNVISQKKLNWQPKIKLEEGLIDFLEWKEKQS
jgi:UDP-glucose 4-epimerase